ncbi:hypothetical protein [Amycolatopsis sp. NPDC102389]|uniref:hypothetical protein n=1 Tax=Amycolatopsis sp. NPDC102389 TaxID=3363941 RepID=UPI00381E49A0
MCTPADAPRVIAPGDPIAEFWMSRPGLKRVLIVIPHLQAGERLLDVLPALESDMRVQVMISTPETGYRWSGIREYVRRLEGLVIPWHQAVNTRFDLILGACNWGLAELDGPILLMGHGAGSLGSRIGHDGDVDRHNLHRDHLMLGDAVIPTVLALATDDEKGALGEACAEALPGAVVAGDPSFDRMLAGRPYREAYREALGAAPGQRIVVVSSTWSKHSLFGSDPTVFARLAEELPRPEHLVVAVLHPFVWHGYGRRQVLAWLAGAREAGLVVLPPEEGWRAALAVADVAVGDLGSVLQYAAGLGVPTLMSTCSLDGVRPGSPAELVSRIAAPLRLDRPLAPQVSRAEPPTDGEREQVVRTITGRPGQALNILRGTCYALLGLAQPSHKVPVSPASLPEPIG